jgi:hypothetical protein
MVDVRICVYGLEVSCSSVLAVGGAPLLPATPMECESSNLKTSKRATTTPHHTRITPVCQHRAIVPDQLRKRHLSSGCLSQGTFCAGWRTHRLVRCLSLRSLDRAFRIALAQMKRLPAATVRTKSLWAMQALEKVLALLSQCPITIICP